MELLGGALILVGMICVVWSNYKEQLHQTAISKKRDEDRPRLEIPEEIQSLLKSEDSSYINYGNASDSEQQT